MWIRMRPTAVSVSLGDRAPTKDNAAFSQQIVSMELVPTEERDHLDLDTGEVFQDFTYATLHKNEEKPIGATIALRPLTDETRHQHNVMQYFGEKTRNESREASSIHFTVFIAPSMYRELVDHVRGGLFPDTISIGLATDRLRFFKTSNDAKVNPQEKPPIEYGWEPDGSGMIWHNKEESNQRIAVESIEFSFPVAKPRYDERRPGRQLPLQYSSVAEQVDASMALIQSQLVEIAKHVNGLPWA